MSETNREKGWGEKKGDE